MAHFYKMIFGFVSACLFVLFGSNLAFATSWYKGIADNSSATSVGDSSDVAFDASGFAHISYSDSTNNVLKYTTNASGEWVSTTVDSSYTAGIDQTSIAVGSDGFVHARGVL